MKCILTPQSPTVTICTTSWTVNNSTFCPHSVFVWIWEQTAIISYTALTDWFLQPRRSVYCAVRTGFKWNVYQPFKAQWLLYIPPVEHPAIYVLPIQCVCVFCVNLRTNSDYYLYSVDWLVFYNRDEECLLRGTHRGAPHREGPGSIPG